jgi:hypothetical protein
LDIDKTVFRSGSTQLVGASPIKLFTPVILVIS